MIIRVRITTGSQSKLKNPRVSKIGHSRRDTMTRLPAKIMERACGKHIRINGTKYAVHCGLQPRDQIRRIHQRVSTNGIAFDSFDVSVLKNIQIPKSPATSVGIHTGTTGGLPVPCIAYEGSNRYAAGPKVPVPRLPSISAQTVSHEPLLIWALSEALVIVGLTANSVPNTTKEIATATAVANNADRFDRNLQTIARERIGNTFVKKPSPAVNPANTGFRSRTSHRPSNMKKTAIGSNVHQPKAGIARKTM
jgi:hypothetical protein